MALPSELVREHWKEFHPARYRKYLEEGTLERESLIIQAKVADMITALRDSPIGRGVSEETMSKEPEKVDDVTELVTICDALRHRQIEPKTVRPEKYKDLDYPSFACWTGSRPRPQATRNKKKSFMEKIREKLRQWRHQ